MPIPQKAQTHSLPSQNPLNTNQPIRHPKDHISNALTQPPQRLELKAHLKPTNLTQPPSLVPPKIPPRLMRTLIMFHMILSIQPLNSVGDLA